MRPLILLRLTAAFAVAGCAVLATAGHAATAPASASSASSATPASSTVAAKVTVVFKTNGLAQSVQNVYYKSGDQTLALSAQESAMSTVTYNYSGNATLEFLRPDSTSKTSAAGGSTAAGGTSRRSAGNAAGSGRGANRAIPTGPMKVVGTVTFPKSGNYVLYMSADPDGSVNAAALSIDAAQFPIGSMRVVNATNYPMAVRINDDFVPLKAYDSLLLPFKDANQFPLVVTRTDVDPPVGAYQQMVAKPSPGMRTTAFITVGNVQQVKDGGDARFNLVLINDNGTTNRAANRGGGNRAGTGTGNRAASGAGG